MEAKELNFNGFKMNGFLGLFIHLIVLPALIFFGFITCVPTAIVAGILCIVWCIMFAGYMQLEPNEARAMVFFGKYKGTFKETGFSGLIHSWIRRSSLFVHEIWMWNLSR